MSKITQSPRYVAPTKEEVRQWLAERIASRTQPPDLDDIREHLWRIDERDRKAVLS